MNKVYLEVLKRSLIGVLDDDTKEKFLNNKLTEYELKNLSEQSIPHSRFYGFDMTPGNGESMIGYTRLTNLEMIVSNIITNKIDGDFIETGVWRGGACIYMKKLIENKIHKKVFVADSFCGLPKPEERYPQDTGDTHFTIDSLRISMEEVQDNFKKYNCLDDKIIFLKGWFKDTLPNLNKTQKFSLIRLDGDMYASTMDALENLYPKLSIGGYTVIDDYALARCKAAVIDFRNKYNIVDEVISIDQDSVFWKKTK
jgi:O-methyltransferase